MLPLISLAYTRTRLDHKPHRLYHFPALQFQFQFFFFPLCFNQLCPLGVVVHIFFRRVLKTSLKSVTLSL